MRNKCDRCQGTGHVLRADYSKFVDCPACGGYGVDEALDGEQP